MSLTINGNLNLPNNLVTKTRVTTNQNINGFNAGTITRTGNNLRNYSNVWFNVPRGTGLLKIRICRESFIGYGYITLPITSDAVGFHQLGWHGYEVRENNATSANFNRLVGNIHVSYYVNVHGHASVELVFGNFRRQTGWSAAPTNNADAANMRITVEFSHIPHGIRANNMLPRAFVTWQTFGGGSASDNRFNLENIFGNEFNGNNLRGLYVIPRWYQHNQCIPIHGTNNTTPVPYAPALQERTVELRQNNFNHNSFNRFNFNVNPMRYSRSGRELRFHRWQTRLQTSWNNNANNSTNIGGWIVAV